MKPTRTPISMFPSIAWSPPNTITMTVASEPTNSTAGKYAAFR